MILGPTSAGYKQEAQEQTALAPRNWILSLCLNNRVQFQCVPVSVGFMVVERRFAPLGEYLQ